MTVWHTYTYFRESVMTSDWMFNRFLADHPEQVSELLPTANEFGMPLHPSAMYLYWQWKVRTYRMKPEEAAMWCETLINLFGEAVKEGTVRSWEKMHAETNTR